MDPYMQSVYDSRPSLSFWLSKDSIYTERYMLTPELNPEGYEHSAVNNMTGFENARYLLVHGTGDDNGNAIAIRANSDKRGSCDLYVI